MLDLSFPLGTSVNDGIPKYTFLDDPFQLHLPGIDSFVALIQKFGKGCLLLRKIFIVPIVSFQWILVIIIILATPLATFCFLTLFFPLVFVLPQWLVNVLPMLSLFFIISRATSLPIMLMTLEDVTPCKMLLLLTMSWNSFSIYWDLNQLVTKTVPHPP